MDQKPPIISMDVNAIEDGENLLDDKFHILLAEDDDSLRETLKELLHTPQRIISLYKNGEDAVDALRRPYVDMVITDLMMPGADGLAVLKKAKEVNPEIVVIIMTGYASLDTALQAIRGGAYDYIRKPFKLEELEIVVHNACERISLIRENKRLLRLLKEALEENRLPMPNFTQPRKIYSHAAKDLGEKISGLSVLLHQMIPPKYDFTKKESPPTIFQELERLIQLCKEGFIDGEEFSELKKLLLGSIQK